MTAKAHGMMQNIDMSSPVAKRKASMSTNTRV